ncbi:MAG: Hsp20 family protein [Proteobacteria bacterium]|nr:Hsp20 family protein [Pseudomonadota bacterium]
MPRVTTFNSPLMLGFDHFEQMLEQLSKSSGEGYPPYNIEQIEPGKLRIILAVAGFLEDDLQITLEQNQLIVQGKQQEDTDRVFLHRGIASRQFQKKFVLAEGVEVTGAEMDNGLLNIDIDLPLPNVDRRQIEIKKKTHKKDMKTIDSKDVN